MFLRQNTKVEGSFLLNTNFFKLILGMSHYDILLSFSILKTKPEFSFVDGSILVNFSSDTLWKSVNKPAFIDVSITTLFSSLVLEDSAKTVVCLWVKKDLPLIYKVVGLLDAY